MGCCSQPDLPPNVPDYVAPAIQRPPHFEIEIEGDPKKLTCPYCNEHVETKVDYQIGSAAITMCAFTMPCLVCWVPLVFNRFKDAKHYCTSCERQLGYFARI